MVPDVKQNSARRNQDIRSAIPTSLFPNLSKPTAKGRTIFTPIQTYCYNSISKSLAYRAENYPSFLLECEMWREKSHLEHGSHYSDVFDGAIWKDMNSFLQTPYSIVLQLNVDWFQPFDHIVYSVGAMYITILNLPSTECYKMKNVFLVGILPGPDESKHDINPFLRPLVDELLLLWEKGIVVNLPNGSVTIKCALGCVACDIPAARNVSGLLGILAAWAAQNVKKSVHLLVFLVN